MLLVIKWWTVNWAFKHFTECLLLLKKWQKWHMHVASNINFCWFYSNNKSITLFLISAQSFVSHLSELSATGQPKDELFLLLTLEFFSFGCQPLFWGCGLLWLSCVTSVSHNSAFTDYSSSFIDRFFLLCISWEVGGTKEVWDG